MPTGVTVAPNGRIFVNYPHWGDNRAFTVGELKDGKVTAYPNAAINHADLARPGDSLISVQSVVADAANRLWILDTASPKFQTPIAGGAKLVAVDLATDKVVRTIVFGPDVVLPTTYLNDVRFDLRQGTAGVAYITDSSLTGPGGIILVDLASGRVTRRLSSDPTTMPAKGFVPVVEGKSLMTRPAGGSPSPWLVASDGIALSPDGATLYYSPLSSRHLYAVSTALLRDPASDNGTLAKAVRDLGLKGATASRPTHWVASTVAITSTMRSAAWPTASGGRSRRILAFCGPILCRSAPTATSTSPPTSCSAKPLSMKAGICGASPTSCYGSRSAPGRCCCAAAPPYLMIE
ncbi:hypothetical protein SPHINGOT1_80005 [Sphingomonas sp. T1]|nr:hypothetical protein SPHINGOT1_80005 [Sphingomonas sp. T1]